MCFTFIVFVLFLFPVVVIFVTYPHTSTFWIEDEWEKELEAELQDYEVVNEQKTGPKSTNWEEEMDAMLKEEEEGEGEDIKWISSEQSTFVSLYPWSTVDIV